MPDFCDLCGANLALVGKPHRCVPKAASVANNKPETVANNTGVANNSVTGVANKAPRWAAWRARNPDLYRERQRNLMRQRRASRDSQYVPAAETPAISTAMWGTWFRGIVGVTREGFEPLGSPYSGLRWQCWSVVYWPIQERCNCREHLARLYRGRMNMARVGARMAVLMIFGFALWPCAAFALLSGNELFQSCEAREGTADNGVCVGYIKGVADTFQIAHQFCPPKGAIGEQLNDVVIKYLRDHPEKRHYSASSLVIVALQRAFPCNKDKED